MNSSNIIKKKKLILHFSSSEHLLIILKDLNLRTFFISKNGQSHEIFLIYPFDIKLITEKIPHNQILIFLSKNFHLTHQKGSYVLSPILKGGGGCPSKTSQKKKNERTHFLKNLYKTSYTILPASIEEKKKDIRKNYFFEQDQYPMPESSEIRLGPFYEELINSAFNLLKDKEKGKFDLSIKNFRIFMHKEFKLQEKKLLYEKLKDLYSGNLETILRALIKILKEELYILVPKLEISEPLAMYEKIILERLIDHSILAHFNSLKSEETRDLYKILMKKFIKVSKFLILNTNKNESKFSKILSGDFKSPKKTKLKPTETQKGNKNKKKKQSKQNDYKTFHLYVESLYKKWLQLSCSEAVQEMELYALRKISWNNYSTFLMTKYYNLSRNPVQRIDKENREFIEKLSFKILEIYQEREDNLNVSEIMELVTLAGIKHEPQDSNEKSINQRLLGLICNDINNDVIFDSFKVKCLATIIFQNTPAPSPEDKSEVKKTSGRLDDDLKQCLDVIHKQVEHRLFTSENQNMQDAMDALNIVLQILAARSVQGLRAAKEKTALLNTFKDQIPNINKQMFQGITGSHSDPSLKMKARFAIEAIKRIGEEDNNLTNEESALVALAPAVYSIVKGVFTLDASAIESGLLTMGNTAIDYYLDLQKDWYEEVNKAIYLSNLDFEKFESRYFTIYNTKGVKTEEVAFFIARQLYNISKNCDRAYSERRKCIEWLADIYEGRNIDGFKLNYFFFTISNLKKDIKIYVHRCLSDLIRMPKEEKHAIEIPLGDIALRVMKRLMLTPIELEIKFEYSSTKSKLDNSLFLLTLKQRLILEYSFGILQNNSEDYYQKEIKEIDYIEIEGIQYIGKIKTNKRVPLWSKFSENAFDEFLNHSGYPVMLIQGDAGTGKSIFLKMIEYQQWKRYKLGLNDYIPIYIRLAEINNVAKCIAETLQSLHSSSLELIDAMKKERNLRNYLFIFDGYDELKAPKNIYECNKLQEYGASAKIIITSREEYLKAYGEYSKYFKANNNSELLEYRITPLGSDQIKNYIQRRVQRDNKKLSKLNENLRKLYNIWNLDKYLNTIKDIHGLEELLKTPYMLKIIIDILPSLGSDFKSTITKSNIYKVFTTKYFENEMSRLLQHSQDQIPKGFDLEKSFYEYSKDLAVNMYMLDKTSVATEGFSYSLKKNDLNELFTKSLNTSEIKKEAEVKKENDPFARFFSNDPVTKLARSGTQLIIFNGQARFTHKSIMEYFAARFFYDELKFCEIESIPKGPLSLKLLYGGNKLNQESDVINFLKQMIDENTSKQHILKQELAYEETNKWKNLHITTSNYVLQQKENMIEMKNIQLNLNHENDKDQDTHILKKIRELMEKRKIVQYPDLFYRNLLILAWFCMKHVSIVSKLTIEEVKDLEPILDFPREIRSEMAQRLALWSYQQNKYDEYYGYSKKYTEHQLRGSYEGKFQRITNLSLYLPMGEGEIKFENGAYYKGRMRELHKHGFGCLIYEKNNIYSRYEGDFEFSKFNGKGVMIYSNNSIYYGNWGDDNAEGFGKKSFYKNIDNKKPVLYEIYSGQWKQGLKHGEGVLIWEFNINSCYKQFYGIWEMGDLKYGTMEYRDRKMIEGLYLEEYGKFFPKDNIENYQFYGIKTTALLEKLYNIQVATMADFKIPGIDELIEVDSMGNCSLMLFLKKSNATMFNNLISSLYDAFNKKISLINHKGENFVHMIIYNKNLDLALKIKTFKNISKLFPKVYKKALNSCNNYGMNPIMVALELLSKDENVLPKLKIDIIKILTPYSSIKEYMIIKFRKLNPYYSKYDRINLSTKEKETIISPFYIGLCSPIQKCLKAIKLWKEKVFIMMLLTIKDDDELVFSILTKEYFECASDFYPIHIKEIFAASFLKDSPSNSKLFTYFEKYITSYLSKVNPNFEEETQKVCLYILTRFIEKIVSEEQTVEKILNKLKLNDLNSIVNKFFGNVESILDLLSHLKKIYNNKSDMFKNIIYVFLSFQLESKSYFYMFNQIFKEHYKIFFISFENWNYLFDHYIKEPLKNSLSQQDLFYIMKFIEFSLEISFMKFSDSDLEKLVDNLSENINFIPKAVIYEKILSISILKMKKTRVLLFLKKYLGKLTRIQNWSVLYFRYSNFYNSPEDSKKVIPGWTIEKMNALPYIKIKEENYKLYENLEIPFNFQNNYMNYKFHEDMKYCHLKTKEIFDSIGFYVKSKEKKEENLVENKNDNIFKCFIKEKMMIVEDNKNLIEKLFSKKMEEVLKYIILNKIYVQDMNTNLLNLNPCIVLDLFTENNFLMLEKEEALKNFSERGAYYKIPNYYLIISDFIFEKINECFDQNKCVNDFLKEPKIQIILIEFFVPSLKYDKFLKSFLNELLYALLKPQEKRRVSRIVVFVLDFLKSLEDLIPKNEYPDFCCEFYFFFEAILSKKIMYSLKVKHQRDEFLSLIESTIEEKKAKTDMLYEELSELKSSEEEFLKKAIEIEQKKLEINGIVKPLIEKFKKIQNNFANKFVDENTVLKKIEKTISSMNKKILNLVIQMIYQKDDVSATFDSNFDIIVIEKLAQEEKNFVYNFQDFFHKIITFNPEITDISVNEETFQKFDDQFRKILLMSGDMDSNSLRLDDNLISSFIPALIEIYSGFKTSKVKIQIKTLQLQEMEKNFEQTKNKFFAVKKNKPLNYFLGMRLMKEYKYLTQLDEELRKNQKNMVLPNFSIYKVGSREYFKILLDYFFSTIWSHLIQIQKRVGNNLPQIENQNCSRYLFEWFDHWFSDKLCGIEICEILTEQIIRYHLNFEEITPFGSIIYERLLFNCIKNNLEELSLKILSNFENKITHLKSWKIWIGEGFENNIESSEKSFILIEDPQHIYIKSSKIIKKLEEFHIDYKEHKIYTLKKWVSLQFIDEIYDIIPIDILEAEKYQCTLENYLFFIRKKYDNEQKAIIFLFNGSEEANNLLIHLSKFVQNYDPNFKTFINFLLKNEQDPIFKIRSILSNVAENHMLETFKTKLLLHCFVVYNKIFTKIAKIFEESLGVLNGKNSNNLDDWILFFVKNFEIIPYFDKSFNKMISFNQQLKKSDDETVDFSIFYWNFVKHFLISYLKGFFNESEIVNFINNMFGNTNKIYTRTPDLDFLQEMIYNLCKSIMRFQNSTIVNDIFSKEKSFFRIVSLLLGYEIEINSEGSFKLKKLLSPEGNKLMTVSELICFKKELISLYEIPISSFPQIFPYKKQIEFLGNSGISISESLEAIPLFVFIIDLIICVLIIEDIEKEKFDTESSKEYKCSIKFQESDDNLKSIEYQSDKKTLLIPFKWDIYENNKKFLIFKANMHNFWDIRDIIQKELYEFFGEKTKSIFFNAKNMLETWFFANRISLQDIKEKRIFEEEQKKNNEILNSNKKNPKKVSNILKKKTLGTNINNFKTTFEEIKKNEDNIIQSIQSDELQIRIQKNEKFNIVNKEPSEDSNNEFSDESFKTIMRKESLLSQTFIDSKDMMLIQLLIYNYLVNELICNMKESSDMSYTNIKSFLKGYKGHYSLLFEIILETFGYSLCQEDLILDKKSNIKESFFYMKKREISFGSIQNLQTLQSYLRNLKVGQKFRKEAFVIYGKDYDFLTKTIQMELPKKISNFSFCIIIIDLAIYLIHIHNLIEKELNMKDEKFLFKFEFFKEPEKKNMNSIKEEEGEKYLPKTLYSDINGIKLFKFYYRFEKANIKLSFNNMKDLKQRLLVLPEIKK